MGRDVKYNGKNLSEIGAEDEPLFVLRAQDRLAIPTIECYRQLYAIHSQSAGRYDPLFADHVGAVISNFGRWQMRTLNAVKLPD